MNFPQNYNGFLPLSPSKNGVESLASKQSSFLLSSEQFVRLALESVLDRLGRKVRLC